MPLIYIQEHGEKVEASRPSPVLTKITTTVKRKGSKVDGGTNLIKVLESTEKELFDCKVQLKTKVTHRPSYHLHVNSNKVMLILPDDGADKTLFAYLIINSTATNQGGCAWLAYALYINHYNGC